MSSLKNALRPENHFVIPSQDLKNQRSRLYVLTKARGARLTQRKSISVRTHTTSRRAQDTNIVWGDPDDANLKNLCAEIEKYLSWQHMFSLTRAISPTRDQWTTNCRLVVSTYYPRLPLYWGNTLADPKPLQQTNREFVTVSIPEWKEQKVLVFPDQNLTILLGSDYVGEHKMSFLRLVMYNAFQRGALGCHAASKIFRIQTNDGLRDKGALIFGLSKTGKTTLTTNPHGFTLPERIFIPQDDIIIFTPDGSAIGTEQNFYVTTEGLSEQSHPTIWRAATSPNALLENVYIDENGAPDFENISITANGRAVIQRDDLQYAGDAPLDVEKIHFIFFITRRNDIVHPLVRLSPEWAALAFLLGESVQTAAGDPTKAGEALRVPGFDPFMLVQPAIAANRFYELLRANPHIQCFLLNTGMVGETAKIYPHESALMMEAVVKGYVAWGSELFPGYTPALSICKVDTGRLSPETYYSLSELFERQTALLRERREYLEQFRSRLHPEITWLLL